MFMNKEHLIHVDFILSTYQEELEERYYSSRFDPFRIIDKTNLLDKNELIELEKDL